MSIMEEHIYEDPDLEFESAKVIGQSRCPDKPVNDAKKQKGKKKKGSNILKSLLKKEKQITVSSPVMKEQGKASLGKGFPKDAATLQASPERNYYIKDGRWVTSSGPSREETKPHRAELSLRGHRPKMADEGGDEMLPDSTLPPPPLPNRQYLLDTEFVAELESIPTVPGTPPPEDDDDDGMPPLPDRYYEDVRYENNSNQDSAANLPSFYEDTEVMEGYVNVPRGIGGGGSSESEEDSDEYIETDAHLSRNIEYVNVAERSGRVESDDSDDYVQPDAYPG